MHRGIDMNAIEKLKHRLAAPELPPAIDAAAHEVETSAGPVFVYEDVRGVGAPVIFVHGIHAAASSREMAPLFYALRGDRPVTAFDLPGFGRSDRSPRRYSRALYHSALSAILERSYARDERPADIVALSLGCELAATVAVESPELVRTLTFISPTGFSGRDDKKKGFASKMGRAVQKAATVDSLGRVLYAALTTNSSIHRYLSKSFVGAIDPELEAYARATTKQKGAHHAPLAFIAGDLFDREVLPAVYEHLTQPVMVIHDTDPYTSFALLPQSNERWRVEQVRPTAGLPQFERPERVTSLLRSFWAPLDYGDRREVEADYFEDGWRSNRINHRH